MWTNTGNTKVSKGFSWHLCVFSVCAHARNSSHNVIVLSCRNKRFFPLQHFFLDLTLDLWVAAGNARLFCPCAPIAGSTCQSRHAPELGELLSTFMSLWRKHGTKRQLFWKTSETTVFSFSGVSRLLSPCRIFEGGVSVVLRAVTTAARLQYLPAVTSRLSLSRWLLPLDPFYFIFGRWQCTGSGMAGAGLPTRQDSRKFFENLSGAGKSIAVLTSGGDAQGNDARPEFHHRTESC